MNFFSTTDRILLSSAWAQSVFSHYMQIDFHVIDFIRNIWDYVDCLYLLS